jgi:hypothetical protein
VHPGNEQAIVLTFTEAKIIETRCLVALVFQPAEILKALSQLPLVPHCQNPGLQDRFAVLSRLPLRLYGKWAQLVTRHMTLAPVYLINLSAFASTPGGIVRPICCAAFRLITNSNFVGRSIGNSPGLAPFRILST